MFLFTPALASRQIKQEHRKHRLFLLKISLTEESDNTCVQCCGSGSVGSVCFWASWIRIRIHYQKHRSRSFYHLDHHCKKNLDTYCFVTSLDLLIFEKLCKCTSKSNKQKNLARIPGSTPNVMDPQHCLCSTCVGVLYEAVNHVWLDSL